MAQRPKRPKRIQRTINEQRFQFHGQNKDALNENSLPHGALRNKLGPFKFPIIEKGRIKEMPMEWTRRSYYQGETLHTVQQVTAVDHLPWGQDLPDVLIRGFPMTTMTDCT